MVDVIVFGPHPDDIEICAGGLVLNLRRLGYTVGGVDMTAGEAGTRGNRVTRAQEASRGAQLLGLAFRECLELPDGGIANDVESRDKLIDVIRRHRPRLLVAPWPADDHPDHTRTGELVKAARFLAGCARIGPPGEPWRPSRVLFYPSRQPSMPTLVVDVTQVFEQKLAAIRAHGTQLYDPASKELRTTISAPGFLEAMTASHRHFGAMIGTTYAEPYLVEGPLAVDDPLPLLRGRGEGQFGAEPPGGGATGTSA